MANLNLRNNPDFSMQLHRQHNQVALLNSEKDDSFSEVCRFLALSNYFTSLTIDPTLYEDHLLEFWKTCQEVIMDGEKALSATVQGKTIFITSAIINNHLQLDDEEDELSFPKEAVNHSFAQMGYEGDFAVKTFRKEKVSSGPQCGFKLGFGRGSERLGKGLRCCGVECWVHKPAYEVRWNSFAPFVQ